MGEILAVTGNAAVAHGMRQIEPHVVAAYPITPQTDVVEEFAQFVSDGKVATEFVLVESEHSAMSTCIGAAAAGARVMTATSSQGLALMWEMLYIASGMRLPVVMAMVNRALSAPINIHCDHSDSMGARDSGWIQLYCKNAQEAYDSMIQAVRIAEHPDVRLPVMVCYDGFIVSHCLTSIELTPTDKVKEFVGKFKPTMPLLNAKKPVTYGPLVLFDYYFELKRNQAEAMRHAPRVIQEVADEYARISGRHYGMFEGYRLDDAEIGIVAMNSTASTAETVVDSLRERGVRAGLLRPRVYRPFPMQEINQALSRLKAVCVMDRADAPGGIGGPLYNDIRSSLLDLDERPKVCNAIYGLGGRDIKPNEIAGVFEHLQTIVETGRVDEPVIFLGVRGG
ncbi:MAG: pyruvate ferredoxin oxidoreductase [Chloroflexota bacterium]